MKGLFARIISKISAFTFLQYINYINNKPIGKIKYTLIYSANMFIVLNWRTNIIYFFI